MQSQNKYIGDDKMQKMLDHYHCEMPLEAVKMRFAGAVCSPNIHNSSKILELLAPW